MPPLSEPVNFPDENFLAMWRQSGDRFLKLLPSNGTEESRRKEDHNSMIRFCERLGGCKTEEDAAALISQNTSAALGAMKLANHLSTQYWAGQLPEIKIGYASGGSFAPFHLFAATILQVVEAMKERDETNEAEP